MNLADLTDHELVPLAAERHEAAQHLLYERYIQRIYSYFMYQLHNVHLAEDLTQETFIRAFNGLAQFRGTASFKNWLYRIAKNQLADYYRDQHSKLVELDEAAPPRQLQKSMDDGEIVQIEEKRAMKRLRHVFFNLPARYKKVLVLRFLKGFSLKETAEAMSLTLSNIKVIQHRAIKLAREKSIVTS